MSAHIRPSLDGTHPGHVTRPAERLGRRTRWLLFAGALAIAGMLGTARALQPDPRGYGTHTQLGLGPCGFRAVTGISCPTCGMTTAFAWAARGRLDRAWQANPAGSLLATACVVVAVWLIACAAQGRPQWGARSVDGPLIVMVVAAVAISLLAWSVRLLLIGRV